MSSDHQELYEYLEDQGYFNLTQIEGHGTCGILQMNFTWGLCIDMDLTSRKGRFCYPSKDMAVRALLLWDGKGDPKGDWVEYKGIDEERSHPMIQIQEQIKFGNVTGEALVDLQRRYNELKKEFEFPEVID